MYHNSTSLIRSQLTTMHQRGQTEISVMLWFTPLGEQAHDCVSAHMVDSSQGRLCNQTAINLAALVADIARIGFSTLYFRFAQQGKADPSGWASGLWNEAQYQQNFDFISDARRIISGSRGNALSVVYDLGVELGGVWAGDEAANATFRYTIRMWREYASAFGTRSDTLGFSFAAGSAALVYSRVSAQVAAFQQTDALPFMWTLDVYGNELEQLQAMSNALQLIPGELQKPFVILECFYDDVIAFRQFVAAATSLPLQISGVFQWPLQRALASSHPNFSIDYAQDFTAYTTGVAGAARRQQHPRTLMPWHAATATQVLRCCMVVCYSVCEAGFIDASPNPCAIDASQSTCNTTVTWASNAGEACVFLETGQLFACGMTGSAAAPWIAGETQFILNDSRAKGQVIGSIIVHAVKHPVV
jgi:hypothetical protein